MKKDKHPITNINPITGVTPKQLLDQCRYLITVIPASFTLSNEENETAINDTVVNVYHKMEQGNVPNKEYELFKGYLFHSLKMAVLKAHKARTYKINMVTSGDVLPEDIYHQPSTNLEFEAEYENQIKMVKKAISMLSVLKQKMLSEVLEGASPVSVCRKYKMNHSYVNQIKEEIKRKVGTLMKAAEIGYLPPKYQQMLDHQPQLCEFESPNEPFNRKSFLLGEKIKQLHRDGCTYNQIKSIMKCSKSTISYYIDVNGKEKVMDRQRRNRAKKKL